MYRFRIAVAFTLLLPACIGTLRVVAAEEPDRRPNIVFAFADDWGQYASAYAAIEKGGLNDVVQTPNFDRIAREGVLFTNAFVNAPSCTPCRSSLLSGQYFWRTGLGAILQGAEWDSSIPVFPLTLQASGYHIGFTSKVWSPGTPADAPFGGQQNAFKAHGTRFNQFSQFVTRRLEQTNDVDAAKGLLLDEVRLNFQDFLKARKSETPFCYWWGPTNCHRKWIQGSGKKLWGIDPDTLIGRVPKFLPDVPEVREDLADYLGEVTAFDAGLGVLLDTLEQNGELDRTLLVVSGDHGAPGFTNGKCNLYDFGTRVALAVRWPQQVPGNRVVEDFVCLPDLAPTFVEAGAAEVPSVMTGRSLMPVLRSDKSGIVDPLRDSVITGRERHVAVARTDSLPYPQRAIRSKNYLYIRNFKPDRWPMGTSPGYGLPETEMPSFEQLREDTFAAFGDMDAGPTKAWVVRHCEHDPNLQKYFQFAFAQRPEEELYDLRIDPDQIHNVAGDKYYDKIREELAEQLLTTLRETNDPRVTDDPVFEHPPYTSQPPPRSR